jgi:hypothetical protein
MLGREEVSKGIQGVASSSDGDSPRSNKETKDLTAVRGSSQVINFVNCITL